MNEAILNWIIIYLPSIFSGLSTAGLFVALKVFLSKVKVSKEVEEANQPMVDKMAEQNTKIEELISQNNELLEQLSKIKRKRTEE